jgi:hypothetical protein
VLAALQRENIDYVALHSSDGKYFKRWPHTALLSHALHGAHDEWRQVRRFDGAPGERTVVFSRVRPER